MERTFGLQHLARHFGQHMPGQQPGGGRQQGQPPGLTHQQARHAAGGCAQHAQHGQVVTPFTHGAPQGNKQAQARRGQQHQAKTTQHVAAHTHQTQQARHLLRRGCGLHGGAAVDEARKGHRRQRTFVTDKRHSDLAVVLQRLALFGVGGVGGIGGFMHLPDRFGGGQDQPVEHTATRGQHAGHGVGVVAMGMPALPQAVGTNKTTPQHQPGGLRHLRTQHHLHGLGPQRALGELRLVVLNVIRGGTDDAKRPEAVAQTQRNHLRHLRVLRQCLHLGQRHVAGRHVDVEHTRQNQLHGAALGPDHGVDTGQIAFERVVDLGADQQHEGHGAQAEGEQQQVQRRSQRTRPQVTKRQAPQIHYIFHSYFRLSTVR